MELKAKNCHVMETRKEEKGDQNEITKVDNEEINNVK